jgi:hypothetical protein
MIPTQLPYLSYILLRHLNHGSLGLDFSPFHRNRPRTQDIKDLVNLREYLEESAYFKYLPTEEKKRLWRDAVLVEGWVEVLEWQCPHSSDRGMEVGMPSGQNGAPDDGCRVNGGEYKQEPVCETLREVAGMCRVWGKEHPMRVREKSYWET